MSMACGTWHVQHTCLSLLATQGATIHTSTPVATIDVDTHTHTARGLQLQDGRIVHAKTVLTATDPFSMRALTGRGALSKSLNDYMDGLQRDGTSLKLNMALRELPRFTCLPEQMGQHKTTIHLLPEEGTIFNTLAEVRGCGWVSRACTCTQ